MQKALTVMERSGAFKPLKAVMKRHLSKVPWKTLFLGLSITSEIARSSSRATRKEKPAPLGRLQSFCGLGKSGPNLTNQETKLLRRGRLTDSQRRSIVLRIEREEKSPKVRKEIGIVFVPGKTV